MKHSKISKVSLALLLLAPSSALLLQTKTPDVQLKGSISAYTSQNHFEERSIKEHSLLDFARNVVKTIVPSANAADLTASSSEPAVNFEDTDTGSNPDWRILVNGNTFSISGYDSSTSFFNDIIYLENSSNADRAIRVFSNGNVVLNVNKQTFYKNGDVSLGDGLLFINDSNNYIELGSAVDSPAQMKFTYNYTDPYNPLGYSFSTITLSYDGIFAIGNVFKINNSAPTDSLVVDEYGTTKMKDAEISFSGSNTSGDGLSKIVSLSANNSASGKTSDVGFSLYNAKSGFRWNFRTDEGSQGFSATKEGTGGAEFLLKNTTNSYQNVELLLGNGAKCTSTGQWVNASSREYKEDIKPLTAKEALLAFEQLKPVKYKFKRDKTKRVNVGFIAEEVPDIVATADRKGINSLEVVALLTKVVQEQKKELERQKKINKELTLRIEKLEKQQIAEKNEEIKKLTLKLEELQRRVELLHSAAFVK